MFLSRKRTWQNVMLFMSVCSTAAVGQDLQPRLQTLDSFTLGSNPVVRVEGLHPGLKHYLLYDDVGRDVWLGNGQWFGLGFSSSFVSLTDDVALGDDLSISLAVPENEEFLNFICYLQGLVVDPADGSYRSTNLLEVQLLSQFGPDSDQQPDWVLDPNGYRDLSTGAYVSTGSPILDVYGADHWSTASRNRAELKTPGDVIELTPGDYQHFRITQSYDRRCESQIVQGPSDVQFGADPQTVIRAQQRGTVSILPNPVGGSQTTYLEWTGAVTFEGLDFVGDDTMGVGSENPASKRFSYHQGFRDTWFFDCTLDGGFDFETSSGVKNKWGILNYMMGRSAYAGPGWIWSGGSITGVFKEHANYFHNIQGDILLENLLIRHCGRTAFQMTNRIGEGPRGVGNLTFRNLMVEDVCLQQGGGGSAFSFNGRHTGRIVLDNVAVRLGSSPDLASPWNNNITGALVVHAGGGTDDLPNGDIVVRNCDFQVGPYFTGKGSARRANIQVRECTSFSLLNTRVAQLGTEPREALDISPELVEEKIILDDDCKIVGACRWAGVEYPDYATMLDAVRNDPKVEIH